MFNIKYERLNKLPILHKFQMDIIETWDNFVRIFVVLAMFLK
jgi:hypothetical protein